MSHRLTGFLVFGVLVFSLVSCGYNRMQAQEEAVFQAWGNLESQIQRRADLVPNLVATVKGAAVMEQETLTMVTEARAKATQVTLTPSDLSNQAKMSEYVSSQQALSSSLSRLLVSVEKYPELKSLANFTDLQTQLEGTENRIAVARKDYNDAVGTFNGMIRQFPYSLTNSLLLHLERKEYFQASEEAKAVPKVEF
ncbi:MAG: LemA family protein [Spirochaetia bacterium]|nr:LemA family protein [Spirochaetia bacterium]